VGNGLLLRVVDGHALNRVRTLFRSHFSDHSTVNVEASPIDQFGFNSQAIAPDDIAVQISQCEVDSGHPHASQVDVLPCCLSQHSGVFCASSRHLRSAAMRTTVRG